MENWLAREEMLIGYDAVTKLNSATVAVIGVGGVGGACAEALCRAGVGKLILVDHDKVSLTNINRQLIALRSTVGMSKVTACEKRLLDINPDCDVIPLPIFYNEETADEIFKLNPDYIIDCIDTVSAKLHLAQKCKEKNIRLLMCLGTGNRLDPTAFKIGDIGETAKTGAGCGLARVMRKELKDRGITHQTVLYSTEPAKKCVIAEDGKNAPGSISFCPPVAGYVLASKVVKDLIEK